MSEPIYRPLLRLNDDSWAKLPKELRGFPVYCRWSGNVLQLWPEPLIRDSIAFGVAFK